MVSVSRLGSWGACRDMEINRTHLSIDEQNDATGTFYYESI